MSERNGDLLVDSIRYGVSTILPAILGLILISIFSKLYSPASFGRYSLAISIATIVSTVATGWLDQAILRFEPQNSHEVIETSTVLVFFLCSTMVVLGLVIHFFLPDLGPYSDFFIPGVMFAATYSLYNTYRTIHQSLLSSYSVSALKVLRAVVRFIFAIGLSILVFHGIIGWIWGAVLASIVVTAILLYITLPHIERRPALDIGLSRRMVSFGVPLIGWTLGFTLLNFSDRLLLELIDGSSSVGIYTSNYMLANQGASLIFSPLIQAMHPLIFNSLSGNSENQLGEYITRYTRYLLLAGSPAIAYAIVLSPSFTTALLAPRYADGYLVVPIVVTGLFTWNLANIGHKSLEAAEKTKIMLIGVIISLLINIIANIPLIQVYGYIGAAIATVMGFLAYPLFIYYVSKEYVPWQIPWFGVGLAFIGCGIIILCYYAFDMITGSTGLISDIILVPITSAVFLIFCIKTSLISNEEIGRVRDQINTYRN